MSMTLQEPLVVQIPEEGIEQTIASAIEDILACLGEDVMRAGLLDTPDRVARALIEMLNGYKADPEEILSRTFEEMVSDDMVIVCDIPVRSFCEHHMLPFVGAATIGYLPTGRIVGLSKLARLTEAFSHRLQVQERLTAQIAEAIDRSLRPKGVGVLISAEHFCMSLRGVRCRSKTITSAMLGCFRDDISARAEFLSLAQQA